MIEEEDVRDEMDENIKQEDVQIVESIGIYNDGDEFSEPVSAFQIVRTLPRGDIFQKLVEECDYKGKAMCLPKCCAENAIYELINGKGMEGMEQKYDGNTWTKPQTQTRSNKTFVLRKSFCGGVFQCMNETCAFLKRSKAANRLYWKGQLLKAPPKGALALGSYGSLECFFCKHVPLCIGTCPVSAYYFMPKDPSHTRLFAHQGIHTHELSRGMCRAALRNTKELVTRVVKMDHSAGPRKVQMIIAKEMILRAFTDEDKVAEEHMSEKEFYEMAEELQGLLKINK